MRIEAIGVRAIATSQTRFIVSVLLTLLLVIGQSAYWIGGSKSLAHVLDHEKAGPALALEEHHGHVSHREALPDSDAPADIEHNLLHEIEHVQLLPLSGTAQRVLFDAALIAVVVLVCVARRGPERTFRPPRPVF